MFEGGSGRHIKLSMYGGHITVACTWLLNKAHPGSFIDFQLLFLTLNLSLCVLSLPPFSPPLFLFFSFSPLSLPSPTRYSDREHPQRQSTLWAISWSIPPPLASTLWRRVPTHSLVSFDNPGHGCRMAKNSLHCSTLPNKVGVVRGHRTVMEIHPTQCICMKYLRWDTTTVAVKTKFTFCFRFTVILRYEMSHSVYTDFSVLM